MFRIHMSPDNDPDTIATTHTDDAWELETQDGITGFTGGELIGAATSRRDRHNHGSPMMKSTSELRCAACRWSEIYIFRIAPSEWNSRRLHPSQTGSSTASRVLHEGGYCVYSLGPSIVLGEQTRARIHWVSSGYEVVEVCTMRRGDRGEPWLPAAHARALAMAANHDKSVENAFVNRAVA